MRKLTIFLFGLLLFSCSQKSGSKKDVPFKIDFVPFSVLQGNLDPPIVLPLLDWKYKIDSLAGIIVDYVNIDDDKEKEMLLVMAPHNDSGVHAIFFLDRQNGKWVKGGSIAQGGELHSISDIPDYSPDAKIFWLNPFLPGNCKGGDYLQGYRFIDGKIKHVLDIPRYHSGCCDLKKCFVLRLENLSLTDSLIGIDVSFNRYDYNKGEGSSKKSNFEKRLSFELFFNKKENLYLSTSTDPTEMKLVNQLKSIETPYPPIEVYIMKEYIYGKFHVDL